MVPIQRKQKETEAFIKFLWIKINRPPPYYKTIRDLKSQKNLLEIVGASPAHAPAPHIYLIGKYGEQVGPADSRRGNLPCQSCVDHTGHILILDR